MKFRRFTVFVITLCSISGACSPFPSPPTPTPTLEPTSTPAPTTTPVSTSTSIITDVRITQPIEGERVEQIESVKGTSLNVPKESVIWMVLFIPSVRRYFPQDLPADIQVNNDWSSIVSIGQVGETDLQADIIAVVADKSAQAAFYAYLQDAKPTKSYPGLERLPDGAPIYYRISVIRK